MRTILSCALALTLLLAGGCVTNMEVGNSGGSGPTTTSGNGGDASTTTAATGGSVTGGSSAGGATSTSSGSGGTSAGGSGGASTTTSGGSGGAAMTTNMPVDDADQDGWTVAEGDCCDTETPTCGNKPELVNPGALEYPGNQIDDDCNPLTIDTDPYPTCGTKAQADSDLLAQAPIGNVKLVKAMDLCQFTTEAPPPNQKQWGVISVKTTLADGSEVNLPKNIQTGVLPDFGPNVKPQYGETMAALSTGTARRLNHPAAPDPGYVHPQNGPGAGETGSFDAGTQCPVPPDYLAANGGVVPTPCGACVNDDCTTAYDSIALRIRIRPPTNARGFSYRFNFFSAEYPEFLCDDYNDFFVALLHGSSAPEIPADENIAKDALGNAISVNNALFDVCAPAVGAPPGSCFGGTLQLVGNGMGGWNGAVNDGGGTGWVQNNVPLALKDNPNPPEPNQPPDQIPLTETFELELIAWDAGDHHVDSIVLLDRFRWNLDKTDLEIHHE